MTAQDYNNKLILSKINYTFLAYLDQIYNKKMFTEKPIVPTLHSESKIFEKT